MSPYVPRRDYRFEYLWEAMSFIEERQCNSCAFKSDRPEYPMCFEIESRFIAEEPVVEVEDLDDEGLVCKVYRNDILAEQAHPDQKRLF